MLGSYDVVIIGGGVIGSSIAYYLSANLAFTGSIAVIERDPFYAASSSSLSTSAIRQQFGTVANIRLSAYSIEFLRQVKNHLAVDGEGADIGLREPGYLILGAAEHVTMFKERNAAQRSCDINSELLDADEIRRRYPWINAEDLAIASYGPEKEGWFDGPALLQAFKRKARSLGVDYIADTTVGLEMSSPDRVGAVLLQNGGRLAAGTVINAAGPWSRSIAAMAGLDLPVVPRKRCVFVFDSPEKIPDSPFIFDTSGFFFRPEGHLYICGTTPACESADDDYGLEVDYDLFDEVIWPALAHRIPGFERLKMLRAWAGLYEYNTFDHSAILGPHPQVGNFVLACGFSGHGMMHAPAAGAGISELIAEGRPRSVDLEPFSFDRIAAGRPIEEHVY